jgi:hypothetical protein
MNLLNAPSALWRGGLIGPLVTGSPEPDTPPIAVPDVATAVAGETIVVNVTANDTDPEGGPLTLVGATANVGSVQTESDGRVTYSAPAGFSGVAVVDYTIRNSANVVASSTLTVTVSAPMPFIEESSPEGTFVINAETGQLDLTVDTPEQYKGTYSFNPADLEAGPLEIVGVRLAGAASTGNTVTKIPGLYVYDETHGVPDVTDQWTDAQGNPLPGETGDSHVVTSNDERDGLGLVETVTQTGGRVATSSAQAMVVSGYAGPFTVVADTTGNDRFGGSQFWPGGSPMENYLIFMSLTPDATSAFGQVLLEHDDPGNKITLDKGSSTLRLYLKDGGAPLMTLASTFVTGTQVHIFLSWSDRPTKDKARCFLGMHKVGASYASGVAGQDLDMATLSASAAWSLLSRLNDTSPYFGKFHRAQMFSVPLFGSLVSDPGETLRNAFYEITAGTAGTLRDPQDAIAHIEGVIGGTHIRTIDGDAATLNSHADADAGAAFTNA